MASLYTLYSQGWLWHCCILTGFTMTLLYNHRVDYGGIVVYPQGWLWRHCCILTGLTMEALLYTHRVDYGIVGIDGPLLGVVAHRLHSTRTHPILINAHSSQQSPSQLASYSNTHTYMYISSFQIWSQLDFILYNIAMFIEGGSVLLSRVRI